MGSSRVALVAAVLVAAPTLAAAQSTETEPAPPAPAPAVSPEAAEPVAPAVDPATDADLAVLRAEIAALRALIDARPVAAAKPVEPVTHDRGFTLSTADGRHRLHLDGYVQGRYTAIVKAGDYDDASGFALRRARWMVGGELGPSLSFRTLIELAGPPLLLDAYADWRLTRSLTIRAGRDKVPFTRGFLIPADGLTFPDRPLLIDAMRWGRDVGVQVRWVSPKVHWQVGVGNGAVDGATDKIPSVAARVQWSVTGDVIDGTHEAGDIEATPTGAATLGFGGIVDALTPTTIGDLVIDADADNDGRPGRVVVVAAGLDLTLRGGGFEAIAEVLWRREDWSSLLRANNALAEVVGTETARGYGAAYVDATYAVWPQHLLAGLRIGYSNLPFLSMRTSSVIPPGGEALEASGMVMLYRHGRRTVGASYRYLQYFELYTPTTTEDTEHRVVIEAQLSL